MGKKHRFTVKSFEKYIEVTISQYSEQVQLKNSLPPNNDYLSSSEIRNIFKMISKYSSLQKGLLEIRTKFEDLLQEFFSASSDCISLVVCWLLIRDKCSNDNLNFLFYPIHKSNRGKESSWTIVVIISTKQFLSYNKCSPRIDTRCDGVKYDKMFSKCLMLDNSKLCNATSLQTINLDVSKVNLVNKGKSSSEEKKKTVLDDLLHHRNIHIRHPYVYSVYFNTANAWHPKAIDDIPWSWLNEEKWRLHTFAKYPQNTAKSAILLAAEGFAYIGVGKGSDDSVICYFCCSVKRHWAMFDVIPEIHRTLCPECPMVTGVNCNNVPMIAPTKGNTLFYNMGQGSLAVASGTERIKGSTGKDLTTDGSQASGRQSLAVQRDSQQAQARDIETDSPKEGQYPRASSFLTAETSSNGASQQRKSGASSTPSTQPSDNDASSNMVTSNSFELYSDSTPVRNNSEAVRNSDTNTVRNNSSTVPIAQTPASPPPTPASPPPTVAPPPPATATTSNAAAASTPTDITQTNTNSENTNVMQTKTGQGARKDGRGPTYSELGIITERPKRYEYALKVKRLETFDAWPRGHHLKTQDLADAGFYYAGYGDCARCFYCGGGLRNWEDNDDVWVEHARWFPKCAYIRQQMGQVFIDTVQDLNKNFDQIPFKLVMEKMPQRVFQLESKDTPLARDPAVRTLVDMGFSMKDVLSVAELLKEEASILSADKLYERLVSEGKLRTTKGQVQQAVVPSTDVSSDLESLRQLKEQNNQLRQQTVCKICMDKEVAVVFLPCGHLVSCSDCAVAMKDCPVCRNNVKGVVRAFMG
ncbi:uncharacterized protein LOC131941938 isoform X2 [Physella acuta]|uniref:uncharacterized protein LOC131941938 isoform X2 n=1 Tax=Physella acuta TaxID=109671 RepID=UPI0027DC6F08|nr:uncharacterized protein LOC131941938 isoform X2 [Physella acuta]